MNANEIIEIIKESVLDDSIKSKWIRRVEEEGLSLNLIDELKEEIHNAIMQTNKDAGIDISNDPEALQAMEEYQKSINAAAQEFQTGMDDLNTKVTQAQNQVLEVYDKIEADLISQELTS